MSKPIEVNIDVPIEGWYDIQIINNGKVRYSHRQQNVLTNGYMIGLAQASSLRPLYCSISSNTGTPDATATVIPNRLAGTAGVGTPSIFTSGSGTDYYTNYRYIHTFTKNQYLGTVNSIGVSNAANGTGLVSWIKLVDGGGNPAPITLITNDQLIVTYTIKAKRPSAIVTGTVTLLGIDYTYSLWPTQISSNSSVMWVGNLDEWFTDGTSKDKYAFSTISSPNVTTVPTGTEMTGYVGQTRPITRYPSQLYLDVGIGFVESNVVGNIACIGVCTNSTGSIPDTPASYRIVCSFSPSIPKTNVQTLSFTFRFTYSKA